MYISIFREQTFIYACLIKKNGTLVVYYLFSCVSADRCVGYTDLVASSSAHLTATTTGSSSFLSSDIALSTIFILFLSFARFNIRPF